MSRVQFGIVWLFLVVKCCCCDEHFENVALDKPCSMRSEWNKYPVDNDVNGNTTGKYDKGNCIQSGPGDYNSFWQVNLGRQYPVYRITIWARESNRYGIHILKMASCKVYVGNTLCYEFPPKIPEDLSRRIDINCTDGVINGRVVKVAKNVTGSTFFGNFYAINFCEVQIWSCSDRYRGSGCDQVCGECRDDAPCDKVTGNCPARCVDGWHGEKCDKTCSVNCTGTCDQNTGNCHGCKHPGILLPLCREGCPDGKFGQNCSESCSQNCADVCDKISGHCTCQAGWEPPNCTIGCSDGYWGSGCDQVCGECRDDASCDKVTRNCPAGCADGWHGEKCDKTCSVGCTGTCDQNTGNCHGCKHPGVLLPLCREDVFTGDDAATDGPSINVIAGSAAGGIAVLVLVVVLLVFLIRRRSHRREPDNALVVNSPDAASVQPNHVYQNVQETDSRPIRSSDTSEETAMPQDTTGDYENVGNDASTYDKLEIYENTKDITNVYTDLKTVQ